VGVTPAMTGLSGLSGMVDAGYDADALDYFTRAEALGGSFNQTAISGTYTEAYIKARISDFVAGCKTDGVWTKLSEVYLYSLVSFDGLMAKLKHAGTATITNTNFVSGDYLAAGANAGLTDGVSKSLNLNFNPIGLTDACLGMYLQTNDSTGNGRLMGARTGVNPDFRFVSVGSSSVNFFGGNGTTVTGTAAGVGHFTGTAIINSQVLYKNGSSIASATTAIYEMPNVNLFGLEINGLVGDTTCRQSMAYVGRLLTAGEVSSLHTRVNTLMTAIGANK